MSPEWHQGRPWFRCPCCGLLVAAKRIAWLYYHLRDPQAAAAFKVETLTLDDGGQGRLF